jgi:hypothetical protein
LTPVKLELLEDLEKPAPPEHPKREPVGDILPIHTLASAA